MESRSVVIICYIVTSFLQSLCIQITIITQHILYTCIHQSLGQPWEVWRHQGGKIWIHHNIFEVIPHFRFPRWPGRCEALPSWDDIIHEVVFELLSSLPCDMFISQHIVNVLEVPCEVSWNIEMFFNFFLCVPQRPVSVLLHHHYSSPKILCEICVRLMICPATWGKYHFLRGGRCLFVTSYCQFFLVHPLMVVKKTSPSYEQEKILVPPQTK